ncbi:MAG: putative ABC-type iron transport system, permease component [Paenibacillaceae bacterium]|jgi:iron complex transport system permease protein|nr:putative ABC-type iron transport system, permease component [Paenibacillaceae bacterium]
MNSIQNALPAGSSKHNEALREAELTQQAYLQSYRKQRRKSMVFLTASVVLLVVLFAASFMIGKYPIAPLEVFKIIASRFIGIERTWDDFQEVVVFNIRLPRILAAIGAGGALSLAGASFQGIFKNPMVSPDILAASSGASVGAALGLLLGLDKGWVQLGAFLFGLGAVAFAYTMSRVIGRGDNMVLLLVLSGMVVSALFQSVISIIKYIADPDSKLPAITYWLMGSIAKVTYADLLGFFISFAIGTIPLILLRWRINVMSFGEDEAKAMGVNTNMTRIIIIACSTLLTASVVSISGTIGWVGLMIPHLVRFMVGPNYKVLIPASLLVGASYLLLVDNLARSLTSYEIPLGILTSMLGAPFFVMILFRKKGQVV